MSLESRKGTCVALGSARALMHMPSVVSDRLMLTASLARRPAQRTGMGDMVFGRACTNTRHKECQPPDYDS